MVKLQNAASKPWWQSKTIRANVIGTALAVIAAVSAQNWIAEYPSAAAGLGAAAGILNVLLRLVTTKPIG